MYGIDVSYFNQEIDWQAVAAAGIKFAICRTGYGKTGFDETFQRNVEGAHRAGLICGAYHYSYAIKPSDAIIEADFCKRIIHESGVLLELPVFTDQEDADGYRRRHFFAFTKRNVSNICAAFIETMKPLNCGIYASYSWLEDLIDWRSLGCSIWNAQWGSKDSFKGYIWQFTDRFEIGGKMFDCNWLYD